MMDLDTIMDKILAADDNIAKNIEKWVAMYPNYEHELIDFAVVWSIMHGISEPPPLTPEMEGQLVSRGMEAMQSVMERHVSPQYPPTFHHSRLDRDNWFDEVHITTVPRFKESELSGDEWRTSAHIQLMRKGNVLFNRTVRDVDVAAAWLAWGLMTVGEDGEDISLDANSQYCSQSGCSEKATSIYEVLINYNDEGAAANYQPKRWRGFCSHHADRGNQSIDDCNENYILYQQEEPNT